MKKRLLFLTGCILPLLVGCATLDAWRGDFKYDPKTGQLRGDMKGAGEGGQYNENTGLNMTWGDNSLPALIIVGLLATGVIFTYPIQRALRLRKEREILGWHKTQKNKES